MLNSPWTRKPDFRNIKEIDYDDYWQHRGWQLNKGLKPREKIMLELIPAGSKVADIGCGNSLLPVRLKDKDCEVKVADISTIVLDQYRKLGIDGFNIDLEKIKDFRTSDQFDYVILSEVLEHIRNPEEVIKVLKSNAKHFIISLPNSAYYQFRLSLMFRGRFFTQWVYHPSEHVRFWSHTDILNWLDAQGLTVMLSTVSDGFTFKKMLPFLPSLWKNLFGFRMVYLCRVAQ